MYLLVDSSILLEDNLTCKLKSLAIIFTVQMWLLLESLNQPRYANYLILFKLHPRSRILIPWRPVAFWLNLVHFLIVKKVLKKSLYLQILCNCTLGVGHIGSLNTTMISLQLLDLELLNHSMTSMVICRKIRSRHFLDLILKSYVEFPSDNL